MALSSCDSSEVTGVQWATGQALGIPKILYYPPLRPMRKEESSELKVRHDTKKER